MINVALLGCGRIGRAHAQAVNDTQGVRLYVAYDPIVKNAQQIADEFGAKVDDYQTILNDSRVGAVLICTPTPLHAEQIADFSKKQVPIFCEKPIALDSGEVKQCLEIVEQHQGRLMVGFNRRFDNSFGQLKQLLTAGKIGDIELIHILSKDPAPPPVSYLKSSGGLFKDMMIHDFDMARFILDEEVVTIKATGACLVDAAIGELGDIDTASVSMQTASGKIVIISNSRRTTYGYDQRVEVHGSKGILQAGNQHNHQLVIGNEQGFAKAPYQHFFMERYEQAYKTEITHFVQNLQNNRPMSPSGFDGLQSLLYAEAAIKSLQTQRTVRI